LVAVSVAVTTVRQLLAVLVEVKEERMQVLEAGLLGKVIKVEVPAV